MGSWSSPDPSGLLYANPTNPQSLNLYAYVLNNPLRYVDPNGEFCYTVSRDNSSVIIDNQAQSAADCSASGKWLDGTADSYSYGVLQISYHDSSSGGTGVLGFASSDVTMDGSGGLPDLLYRGVSV